MPWDKEKCAEGILAPDLNDEIRANWAAIETMLDDWMRFATGGVQTGQPRQGSARVYFQDAVPTSRLDGEYFDLNDLGAIWIDSNTDPDNQLNILTAADGAGTETWTPISTEIIAVLLAANRIFAGTLKSTGNFTVGANKVTMAGATGNTAIAGTLGVTGVATVAKGSLLASSDAPTTDAMIACKKYIDDQIATIDSIYGTKVFVDSDAQALVNAHTYKVTSDGVVTAIGINSSGADNGISAFSSSSAANVGNHVASTRVGKQMQWDNFDNNAATLEFHVIKNEYFEVQLHNMALSEISFTPIGSGECQDQD